MKTENWILQQSPRFNLFAAIQNLLHYSKIKTGTRSLYRKIVLHPEYPTSKVLDDFFNTIPNVEAMVVKIDRDKLDDIPLPALALIIANSEEQFVMLSKIDKQKGFVKYIHPAIGWIEESLNDFCNKWNGICYVVFKSKKTITIDYDTENEKAIRNLRYKSNKVKIYPNFLTDEECNYIINLARPKLKPSGVNFTSNVSAIDLQNEAFIAKMKKERTSFSAFLPEEDNDPVIHSLKSKVSKLTRVPMDYIEYIQCTSYKVGQEYKHHVDSFSFSQKDLLNEGNRACTVIVYLNDSFSGGGTFFPELDIVIQPKKGTAVRFFLLTPYGNIDPEMVHAGLPVFGGEKFILNIWIRDKVFLPRLNKTKQLSVIQS